MKPSIPAVLIAIAVLGFMLSPAAQAVSPPPDGGYPNGNAAEGDSALTGLTSGFYNSAVGFLSLLSNGSANFNTGVGAGTLLSNTANENTATGAGALLSNTSGSGNTANGAFALMSNTSGAGNSALGSRTLLSNTTASFNTAIGAFALTDNIAGFNTATGYCALCNNTTGSRNTADGESALALDVIGNDNTATGYLALANNTGSSNTATGSNALVNNTGDANTAFGFNALASNTSAGGLGANTAVGADALEANTSGADNVGIGLLALVNNSTGSANTALGAGAGAQITGDNNTDIGDAVAGVAGESNTTRIGNSSVTATYVSGIFGQSVFQGTGAFVDSTGKLGTVTSSQRFKQDIKPMDKASEAILALKPVTFHYKSDKSRTSQFGLVAEEVAKVNPVLVLPDKDGKPYTVRYDAVNAMLLNEFLKEHKKTEKLEATVASLISTVKEQAAQIQKVSAQLEASRSTPQVVANNQQRCTTRGNSFDSVDASDNQKQF